VSLPSPRSFYSLTICWPKHPTPDIWHAQTFRHPVFFQLIYAPDARHLTRSILLSTRLLSSTRTSTRHPRHPTSDKLRLSSLPLLSHTGLYTRQPTVDTPEALIAKRRLPTARAAKTFFSTLAAVTDHATWHTCGNIRRAHIWPTQDLESTAQH
jgi:hypothetical protein